MKSCIAYIDDDIANLECVKTVFNADFRVEIFQDPNAFLSKFSEASYGSILVDVHMPNISGFSLYEKIIQHPNYNGCPILFISSDDSETSRIKSFELGAVDFIPRETHPDEMIARVKSKIKFFELHRNIIEFGTLRINLTLLKTFIRGAELPLTFIELRIICLVLRNYPDLLPKDVLVEQVWKTPQVLDATIHTHIFNLNVKLKDWEYEINSVKGKGIQLVRKANQL